MDLFGSGHIIPHLTTHGICYFLCHSTPTKVPRNNALRAHVLNTLEKFGADIFLAQPCEHFSCCPERANGVGDALSRDVECGAVNRLEHAGTLAGRVEVGCCRDADGTGECGC